jgi:hypothetical protein
MYIYMYIYSYMYIYMYIYRVVDVDDSYNVDVSSNAGNVDVSALLEDSTGPSFSLCKIKECLPTFYTTVKTQAFF